MSNVADEFASLMEEVAEKILGKPHKRNKNDTDVRFGANHGVSVNYKTGEWFSHVDGVGGGVIDLVCKKKGMERADALDWLRDEGILEKRVPAGSKRVEATYDYVDEHGMLLFQVVRYWPKSFAQRRPDPSARDGWAWGVKGVRAVPYRLPELQEAVSLGRVVFVVEGEKKVEALARVGIVATCNAGGSKKWQESFGRHLKGADVVILPDNDQPGRDHRDQVAGMLAGVAASVRVLELPGLGPKHDIVNWLDGGGTAEELWRLVEEAAAPPPPSAASAEPPAEEAPSADALLLGFVFDGDAPTEPPRYLVKNLLPETGVTILGGQSGAGKTFAAIDLAVSLATGEPFFGRRVVERVGTLILAAEGAGTIEGRVTAARLERTKVDKLPISWLGAVGNLADQNEVRALLPKIRAVDEAFRERFGVRLGLIVIDTLAAAFALKDENDAAEAQGALRHMRMLGDPIGALVLPVHHYGKSEDVGLRGSSAYRGGADGVLSVLAERNNATGEVGKRSLNLAKTRHGAEGPIAGFSLRFVELGTDDDGDPYGACVVVPDLDAPAPARTAPQKDPLPIVALKGAFDEVMIARGREVPVLGNGPKVRAITIEELRPEFRRRYATGETDDAKVAAKVRQALKRALDSCPKFGFHTAEWGGEEWLWRLYP